MVVLPAVRRAYAVKGATGRQAAEKIIASFRPARSLKSPASGELTELLDQALIMPTDHELDALADRIDQTLETGAPAQRKALIEALVEEIQVIGPGRIRPVYRIPRHIGNEPTAAENGTTVRPMGNLVVLTEHLSVEVNVLASLHSRAKPYELDTHAAAALLPQPRPPRQVQRRFTAAEAAEIAEQYLAGQTMNRLARTYGVHRRTVAHCLQKQEVSLRQLGLSPDHLEQAVALYDAGWSLARIGDKYGTTDMTVRRALSKHGLGLRPRNGWS